jgi:hypothetical protein
MTSAGERKRSDWILLALLVAERRCLTAVKLQKTLFLLGERRRSELGDGYYQFRPYHYGPFDAEVYRDADALEASGLIEVDRSQGRSLRRYLLTDQGEAAATAAANHQSVAAKTYLTDVVSWAQPLPFNVLVRAIYDEFPEMRANSIFEER